MMKENLSKDNWSLAPRLEGMHDQQEQGPQNEGQQDEGKTIVTDEPSSPTAPIAPLASHENSRAMLHAHFQGAHVHYCTGWSSALYTALLACDVAPGDEVIIPALAPAGIVHAVLLAKARPILVDVNADDLLIDQGAVLAAITERTRCVVLCHLYGQVSQHEALYAHLAADAIALIEDGSDAFLSLGSCDLPASHCDMLVGCLPDWRDVEGELPAFIITRNQAHHARMSYWTAQHDIAERLLCLESPEAEEAPYVDLVGALSDDQDWHFQNNISYSLNTRAAISKQVSFYDEALASLGLRQLPKPEKCERLLQRYPVCVEPFKRDSLFDDLFQQGFKICRTYRNLAQLKFFFSEKSAANFPNAASWSAGAISLPTGHYLSLREQKRLTATLAGSTGSKSGHASKL
ncbi:DegT/DnrJ/EryC1/StrS family aminotransferase [uncultured Cohaesibacter sp.]|uniref:DegT/DnrJ/EryC1/StrS family aminotransferase n=1 Tax=uncultured Cohaesibacter sp. TaxID=1002546 RepID=UPI0029C6A84E|nr:DegT/DnrJ/EryC1/StrS family aminotransferase [uncultured Cohaesibacter sp.]